MADSKDSITKSGWKAEVEMLAVASEMEFLRWFYYNSDATTRAELIAEFHRTQQKALPANLC